MRAKNVRMICATPLPSVAGPRLQKNFFVDGVSVGNAMIGHTCFFSVKYIITINCMNPPTATVQAVTITFSTSVVPMKYIPSIITTFKIIGDAAIAANLPTEFRIQEKKVTSEIKNRYGVVI